jgi:hypothetical protein
VSSIQRRRGTRVKLYREVAVEDSRGNVQSQVDLDHPHVVRAAAYPQRSSRAEVSGGQMDITVVRLIVDADLLGVGLWSKVEYLGEMWDVATPPALHVGERFTRHVSIDIRRRPGGIDD